MEVLLNFLLHIILIPHFQRKIKKKISNTVKLRLSGGTSKHARRKMLFMLYNIAWS